MRIFNSLIVPKNVKGDPLGFFNIHSGAKHQKKGGPFEDFEKFRVSQSQKRGGESLIAPKNWKGGPFWVLHFKVEAFGCVQNQVLSTFGKSESFTKSGTYAMSEKADEIFF